MAAYRSSTSPVKKGDTLIIGILTVNTSDVPTAPGATPTVSFYASDDLATKSNAITTATVTAITGETGAYVISLATSSLTAGTRYHALVAYTMGGADRRQIVDVIIG